MHDCSGLPLMAAELAPTGIEENDSIDMNMVGTLPLTVAEYPPLPLELKFGLSTLAPVPAASALNSASATVLQLEVPSFTPASRAASRLACSLARTVAARE